jgi:hypothetical protein
MRVFGSMPAMTLFSVTVIGAAVANGVGAI